MAEINFRSSDLPYYSVGALRALEQAIKTALRKLVAHVYDREEAEKLIRKHKKVTNERLRRNGSTLAIF